MERTISNPTRQQKKRHFKSAESRKRAATAGARNLAAYRARIAGSPRETHGVVALLRGGNVSAEISNKLDAFEAGLLSDLGGDPTTAQRGLIDGTRTALGVCLLASAYLGQGSLSKFKRNRWVLSTLATYLNTLRLNLQTLGLERRTKDAMTLDSVLADIEAKRRASAAETGGNHG
jgi:hypothetical protein